MDIAPQYAGILMGFGNTFATVPGIVSPILCGYIVTDEVSSMHKLFYNISFKAHPHKKKMPMNFNNVSGAWSGCCRKDVCILRLRLSSLMVSS